MLLSNESQCFSVGRKFPKVPLSIGDLGPHVIDVRGSPASPCAKRQLDWVSCLCVTHASWSLYFAIGQPLLHLIIAPSHEGSGPPSNIIQSPQCILIGSAICAELTSVPNTHTHTHTDRPCHNKCCMYYAMHMMQPNNYACHLHCLP